MGFPAFAVHQKDIVQTTFTKCVRRLKGNYGFKRFLRDGANHLLENKNEPFYNSSEVKVRNFLLIKFFLFQLVKMLKKFQSFKEFRQCRK